MRLVRHIDVFVASPGDVNVEREMVVEAANELNITWGRALGVHLDIIRWETHTVPDFGEDAQDVINSQLPHVYDVFIGIFWTRFGTPTLRASSGTEEEFLRAYENYQSSGKPRLLLYFNKSKVDTDLVDVEQLVKIRAFREKASKLGGYYVPYPNVDSFRQLVRTHLSAIIREFNGDEANSAVLSNGVVEMGVGAINAGENQFSPVTDGNFQVVIEKPEFLDILAEGEEKMEQISGAFVDISTEMARYTERVINSTKEMSIARSAKEQKRISLIMAGEMSAFANTIRQKYGLGFSLLTDVISAVGDVIILLPKDGKEDSQEGLKTLHDSFFDLSPVVKDNSSVLKGLSSTVENVYPGTAAFRKAKQEFVDSLNEQVEKGETVAFLIDQVIAAIKSQIDEMG